MSIQNTLKGAWNSIKKRVSNKQPQTYARPLELEIRKAAAEATVRTKKYDPLPDQLYSNIECRKGAL